MKLHWMERDGKAAIENAQEVDDNILEYKFQIINAYTLIKHYAMFGKFMGFLLGTGRA